MKELEFYTKALIGMQLTENQLIQFDAYEKHLITWNEKTNLTSIISPQEIIFKHFFDSLFCHKFLNKGTQAAVIDVGSGAGFPGIPLKISDPTLNLTILESVGKKVEFCEFLTKNLELDMVTVIHGRAEDIGQNTFYREKFDVAVARAVAKLPVLAEYLLPLVKTGGFCLAMKGPNIGNEIQDAKKAIKILGGEIETILDYDLPDNMGSRSLIKIYKKEPTPLNYPRRAGTPEKKPII